MLKRWKKYIQGWKRTNELRYSNNSNYNKCLFI